MEQVLLVVQVIIAIGLIGMVLIQRSDSDGFGLGSGSGNNLLSGRSAASAMTRVTAIFAALFIINSLVLAVLAAREKTSSIVETIEQQQSEIPSVPLAGADAKGEAKKDAAADAEKKPVVKKVKKEVPAEENAEQSTDRDPNE